MKYRTGTSSDADAIAGLVASFQPELTDDPSGAGAEEYLASVSTEAERRYLESERYKFTVAVDREELVGFIGCRDGTHIFHLFVTRTHQRRGIARELMKSVLTAQIPDTKAITFTVNSSLRAESVYEAFGFKRTSSITKAHGISFIPMSLRVQYE